MTCPTPSTHRAVSPTISFVLFLGILTLFSTTLIVGATDYADGHQNDVASSTTAAVVEDTAAALTNVDHVASRDGVGDVRVRVPTEQFVGRNPITLSVTATGDAGEVMVAAQVNSGEVRHFRSLNLSHDVVNATVRGGAYWIVANGTTDTITIKEAQ